MPQLNPEKLGLNVNFTPGQREFFDKLKAELLELFSGRSYDEIKDAGETALLKKISDKLGQMQYFAETKTIPAWTREQVIDWAERFHLSKRDRMNNAVDWVDMHFGFKNNRVVCVLPLSLSDTTVDVLPEGLLTVGDLYLQYCAVERLPERLRVNGDLDISHTSIEDLPDDLEVEGHIYIANCLPGIFEKAMKLKTEGKIKGEIAGDRPDL